MKYSNTNKPLVCMQTQSTCYKGTVKMTPVGVLWHSTAANNTTLKRYVQPSDTKPAADTYTKDKWLEILGKNKYSNDWNHIKHQAGLNCWIGTLADGTVTTVQTMPWDYKPWGCGSGKNGSCNNGWMQFEICEDDLTSRDYFNKVYQEACEITAYLCQMYNIDPKGTVTVNGVKVPTILCHADSYKLGLGNNHGDVYHWFNKYGKTMDDVRNDVAKLLKPAQVQKLYRVRKSWKDVESQKGAFADLNNAKECCQTAGKGYKVFDWEGNEVYTYVAPEPVKKAVYDLEYPEKHLIIEASNAADAFDEKECTRAIVAIKKNNANFNIEIAKAFFTLAPKYRVNPMRAISQSILETGWFKFEGSSVKPEQNNFCGLGATGSGVCGTSFETIIDGVRAQLQHLYAYGCKDDLPDGELVIDPRFKYVTRGIAPYWEQLAGRWAVPGFDGKDAEASVKEGTTYGQKIDNIYNRLLKVTATEEDINTYFPKEIVEDTNTEIDQPEVDTDVDIVDTEKVDTAKVNTILGLLEKLLRMLISVFTKKTD